jgi:hypothetical protein
MALFVDLDDEAEPPQHLDAQTVLRMASGEDSTSTHKNHGEGAVAMKENEEELDAALGLQEASRPPRFTSAVTAAFGCYPYV